MSPCRDILHGASVNSRPEYEQVYFVDFVG